MVTVREDAVEKLETKVKAYLKVLKMYWGDRRYAIKDIAFYEGMLTAIKSVKEEKEEKRSNQQR